VFAGVQLTHLQAQTWVRNIVMSVVSVVGLFVTRSNLSTDSSELPLLVTYRRRRVFLPLVALQYVTGM